MKKILALLTLLPALLFAGNEKCTFTLSSNWKLADPKKTPDGVTIALVYPKKGAISPSLNLTEEITSLSQEAYVDAVTNLYARDAKQQVRSVGDFLLKAGNTGHLLQIDRDEGYVALRQLQLIIVQEGKAHILTATVAKEEFLASLPEITAILRSTSLVKQVALRDEIRKQIDAARENLENELYKKNRSTYFFTKEFQGKKWRPFERLIETLCADEGPYFQLLLIQEEQKKLLKSAVL